jgi:ABC-type branched-subunit amino acid transport system ATPase component
MLKVTDIGLRFGGIHAIQGISFAALTGQVLGLIGPNGAGKTSLFNCITGFYKPTTGTVTLDGEDITGRKSYQISRRGIRRTFQNIRLFNDLSVYANIVAGGHVLKTSEEELSDRCHALCGELQIGESYLARPSGDLPYGIQRRVELARALIADPKILLVDEPGAGLNGAERQLIVGILRGVVRERKLGVILIEHDIGMIARACDRVVVLDRGKLLSEGTPDEVRQDPAVISAYLGN